MPTFQFTSPEGKSYSLTGPEGATPQDAFALLQKQIGTPAPSPQMGVADTAADVAKSTGIGVVKGAIGLAGLPGDIADLGTRGIDYLAGTHTNDTVGPYAKAIGSQNIRDKVEGVTGPLYEPKSTLGKYGQNVGELGLAAIGGPEALASRLMTRAVLPGVASEAAGQATQGTALEPVARIATAMGTAGAAGAYRSYANAGKIGTTAGAPSRQAIKDAAEGDYQVARNMGVEVKPAAVEGFSQKAQADLSGQGFRDYLAPKTFAALKEMENAPPGSVANLADLEGMRRVLGNAARDYTNPSEQAAASQTIKALDKHLVSLGPNDVLSGDINAAQRVLGDARSNYSAAKLSETIDKKQVRAELRAAAANSGMNVANTIRQRMADLLLNPKDLSGFTAAERAQMERIVRGSTIGNTARAAGNMLGGGGGMHAFNVAALGALATGGPGVIAPAIGTGLKMLGNASTMRQVRALDRMVRSRSPLAQQLGVQQGSALPNGLLSNLPPAKQLLLQGILAAHGQSQ